ncbi:MAG: NAD-dependent epimerase/dehydratase family protein [Thermodesulfobacteriota bacterium]
MRKVLVTGGGGFVGKALVQQVLQKGIKTIALGRNDYPDVRRLGAEVAVGDIRDKAFLFKACRKCDTVFHTAAKAGIWGDREEYFSINVTGTANVLAACIHNAVPRLIYTSTPSVVFDRDDIEGGDESLPYPRKFLCHYAQTKALAEKMILKANSSSLKTVALRPHLIWGPDDTNLIPRLLQRGRKSDLKIVGNGNNLVDITYIDNVIQAHLLAADDLEKEGRSAGRAYFISQGEPVRLWEWINSLFSQLDIPPVTRQISFRKARLAGLILECYYKSIRFKKEPPMTRFMAEQLARSHWFSLKAAVRDLNYSPRISTNEGVRRLVNSLRQN